MMTMRFVNTAEILETCMRFRGERRRGPRSRSLVPRLPPADRLAWPGSPVVHAAAERDEAGGAAVLFLEQGAAYSWQKIDSRIPESREKRSYPYA